MAEGILTAIKVFFSRKKQYNLLRLDCREYAEINYSWKRHIYQLRAMLDNEMHLLPIN